MNVLFLILWIDLNELGFISPQPANIHMDMNIKMMFFIAIQGLIFG